MFAYEKVPRFETDLPPLKKSKTINDLRESEKKLSVLTGHSKLSRPNPLTPQFKTLLNLQYGESFHYTKHV